MKKRKKILYYSSLLITIILLVTLLFLNSTYSEFDSSNVKNTISLLSSDTFRGRLAGTDENSLVSEFIKRQFKSNGLKPFKESYNEDFDTICPINTNTSPFIKILNNGEIQEELQYGVDFKEDMLNFKNDSFLFSNKDKVNIYNYSIEVTQGSSKFLLYVPNKDDFSFRSSFMSNFPYDAIIMITSNTKNKLVDSLNSGNEISIHLPFTNEEKTITNIVGTIEGKTDSLPPLILTAHFDHLGQDGLGNNYLGALDNASGTAFILELQRSLSTFGKPNRDIIFVALNAEEFGLLGSKHFAENNYFDIKGAEVLNFDMIGSANFPITFMQGTKFKDENSDLLNSLESLCKKKDVEYEVVYQDSSDHASFNNLGIDAISFCHSDMSKIHTPNDTIDYIDKSSIETVYSIVDKKIKESCYSKFTLFIYNKNSIIALSIILGSLVGIPLLNRKVKKRP